MFRVGFYQQRKIEKDFLTFAIGNLMAFPIFIAVTLIPFKTRYGREVNHFLYIAIIYRIRGLPTLIFYPHNNLCQTPVFQLSDSSL